LNLNILMEAQDDYFVNTFTPLYKILSNSLQMIYLSNDLCQTGIPNFILFFVFNV